MTCIEVGCEDELGSNVIEAGSEGKTEKKKDDVGRVYWYLVVVEVERGVLWEVVGVGADSYPYYYLRVTEFVGCVIEVVLALSSLHLSYLKTWHSHVGAQRLGICTETQYV